MELLEKIAAWVMGIPFFYVSMCMTVTSMLYGRYWARYYYANEFFDQLITMPVRLLKKIIQRNQRKMKTVTIYTDGACSGNPGPGGWGAILMYSPHQKELSGGEASATNNRMELTAVISALELLKEPCAVDLWSDSKYVIDALDKGWAKGWRAKGWIKSDKKPALNPDLWARLLELCEIHTVRTHWVKGHAENPYNNRCDELAVAESRKYK